MRNPRVGDNILYRVGDHDVYFIPVYTAGAGGVVAQLGTIAAVGAAFNGEYFVGLGETQEEAFEAILEERYLVWHQLQLQLMMIMLN